jgi:diphthine synthase
VESGCDDFLKKAKTENVAFLVVGDPFGATTHMDLYLRAANLNIKIQVIHNASIMNAIAACGLQLYSFGQTVSIVFFEQNWRPDSFYDKIKVNKKSGMHTLCLLGLLKI